MRINLVSPVVLLILGSQAATAQQIPQQFETLQADQLVRIRTTTHGLHIGRVVEVSGDSLYLRPEQGSESVEMAAVKGLWVRGTATVKGAKIGGILGATVGGALAAMASVAFCDAASCTVDAGIAAGGLLVGGVTGAVSGAVIGAMFGQWHRRYP